MPKYLTSTGVQHFTITIPNGSASATATISAVGSRAFLVFGGMSADGNLSARNGLCYLTLTNSTTVTATRTGTANSVTISGCIVDATASLVESVEYGIATIPAAATSGTDTIVAVDPDRTVIHFLGFANNDAAVDASTILARLSLTNPTTVTSENDVAATSTLEYSFVAIQFTAAALNSNVQFHSLTWANSASSATQAITAVDVNDSILFLAGFSTDDASMAVGVQRLTLTNSTTVTVKIGSPGASDNHINFFVVEFASGVLKSNVQRGDISIGTGGLSNTATITAVETDKTMAMSTGMSSNTSALNRSHAYMNLTNSTTVTSTKQGNPSITIQGFSAAEFEAQYSGSTLLMMGVG